MSWPAPWHDTAAYQASGLKHDREIRILDKSIPVTLGTRPFMHMKKIEDKDILASGGLSQGRADTALLSAVQPLVAGGSGNPVEPAEIGEGRDALPGVRLQSNLGGGGIKAQLKRADKSGATVAPGASSAARQAASAS